MIAGLLFSVHDDELRQDRGDQVLDGPEALVVHEVPPHADQRWLLGPGLLMEPMGLISTNPITVKTTSVMERVKFTPTRTAKRSWSEA